MFADNQVFLPTRECLQGDYPSSVFGEGIQTSLAKKKMYKTVITPLC